MKHAPNFDATIAANKGDNNSEDLTYASALTISTMTTSLCASALTLPLFLHVIQSVFSVREAASVFSVAKKKSLFLPLMDTDFPPPTCIHLFHRPLHSRAFCTGCFVVSQRQISNLRYRYQKQTSLRLCVENTSVMGKMFQRRGAETQSEGRNAEIVLHHWRRQFWDGGLRRYHERHETLRNTKIGGKKCIKLNHLIN